MAEADLSVMTHRFGRTARKDAWWARPTIIFICLSAFVVYATWAALQGNNYYYGSYLSPLYSPEIYGTSPHSWMGPMPASWPSFIPRSPALLILWAPGLFRLTCYYYRGAYYKSFFTSPVACTVSEFGKAYTGEKKFPLILQNVHRYFMYIALVFLVILSSDVWRALWFTDPGTGARSFGIGIGTLVLAANVVFLAGYTFGCHSLRHAVGGIRDRLSGAPIRRRIYLCAGCFNRKHMLWAWMSLFWVAFTDIYIRLCATGVWSDWKIVF